MTNVIPFPRVYVASNDHVRHAFTSDEILVQAGMSLYAVAGLLGTLDKTRSSDDAAVRTLAASCRCPTSRRDTEWSYTMNKEITNGE